MKVVVVHNRYRSGTPSGENRVVDTEAAALRAGGHEVIPVERHSDDIATMPSASRAVLALSAVWNPAAGGQLAAVLRRTRPDVVHVHNTFPLFSASVLGACAAERVPVVATLHNYRMLCAGGQYFRAGRPCHDCDGGLGLPAVVHGCYRSSPLATVPVVASTAVGRGRWRSLLAAAIFVSDAQRRALAGLDLPPARSFVKWNLVPRRSGGDRCDEPVALFAGRLDESKGIRLLMRSWDRLTASPPAGPLRLVIAGSGPLEAEVRAWAAARRDVEVCGQLTPEACRAVMRRARAVVVPSSWEEPFGLVAVEAMAAGAAVVGAAHGSLPELVVDGRDGVLFQPGEATDLARALRHVAEDPERWRERGAHARRSYEVRFDPDGNLDQLVGIYRFAVEHPVWAGPIPAR